MHCLWTPFSQSLWFSQRKWILWPQRKLGLTVCNLNFDSLTLFRRSLNYSLWSQTWKYTFEKEKQVRNQDYWFWKLLFAKLKSLHVHSILILLISGGDIWYWLHSCYWYVVIWMCFVWTFYRWSPLSGWEWTWIGSMHHVSQRSSSKKCSW